MEHNPAGEPIPIGSRIKNWTVNDIVSTGTYANFYTASKKKEKATIKVVRFFSLHMF